jgi:hypothetical protein
MNAEVLSTWPCTELIISTIIAVMAAVIRSAIMRAAPL